MVAKLSNMFDIKSPGIVYNANTTYLSTVMNIII